MKPILFVDLDRTLFDTVGFFNFVEKCIKSEFNVTTKIYEEIHPLYAVESSDPMLRYSDFDEILTQLHITKEAFKQVIIDTAGKNTFILPDAVNFIDWLKQCNTHEVRILSFGQYYFQMLKLLISPVLSEFPEHIIMQRKSEYISKEYTNYTGMLIDDKPNQALPEGWVELFIDRSSNESLTYIESETMIRITTLADAPKHIHSAHI